MRPFVIYHHQCSDGIAAAWVVWNFYNGDVDLFPGVYGESAPDVTDRRVILVDFSYKQDIMRQLAQAAADVLVIDHHQTARDDLTPLLNKNVIRGVFDMAHCGAMLTWQWYFPDKPAPRLLQHIQDRDLFTNQLSHTRELMAGLRSYPNTVETIAQIVGEGESGLAKLIEIGTHLVRDETYKLDHLKENVKFDIIGGYRVPIVNAPHYLASELGNALSEDQHFAAVYWDTPNGRYYSLRSRKNVGVDVAKVAQQYGGGGHKHAAGFKVSLHGRL